MFVRWTVLVFLLLYFHHKFNIVQVFLFVIHTDILLQGRLRQSNERIRYGTSGWVIVHLFLVPVIALIGWTTYALANYGMTYTGKTHSTSLGFISSFGYLLVRSSLLTDIYRRCQGDFPSLGYRRLQLKYMWLCTACGHVRVDWVFTERARTLMQTAIQFSDHVVNVIITPRSPSRPPNDKKIRVSLNNVSEWKISHQIGRAFPSTLKVAYGTAEQSAYSSFGDVNTRNPLSNALLLLVLSNLTAFAESVIVIQAISYLLKSKLMINLFYRLD